MKVLLTGAFGNVGASTLKYLLEREYEITCFDKSTFETRQTARRFKKSNLRIIWSDIRNKKAVEKAVQDQDLVLHVAAIIPPKANRNNKYTMQVNFGGTKNVVDAIKAQKNPPRLIYTSSVAIYGDVRNKDSPIVKEDLEPNPSPGDHYAVTKLNAEKYIKESGVEYTIFRLSYIPNSQKIKLTPLMFRMPLDTPIEFTHTEDTGLALANAIESKKVMGKTFNLGGGAKCQFYYKDYLERMLPLMGIEMLPDEAFGDDPFHCCYYDTIELNKLLQFQNHTFEDLLQEMVANAQSQRRLAIMFKPFVKPALLALSPYYKKNMRKKKKKE
ncbi:MAG: NAD-dependent epimerase/dehydratase family protein [Candidatus Heimdallarchaeota archaeon]